MNNITSIIIRQDGLYDIVIDGSVFGPIEDGVENGVVSFSDVGELARTRPEIVAPYQEEVYTIEMCLAKRKAAYTIESDPIYMEAVRNSMVDGGPPDLQDWLDKVQEIKDRYPKP